jgi:hypothetical protein
MEMGEGEMIPNPLRALGAILEALWPVETRPLLSVLAAEQLADDEAERDAWRTNELYDKGCIRRLGTSSVDGAATSPPAEESPAAAASATSAAAGHPTLSAVLAGAGAGHSPKLAAAAAFGLRQWLAGKTCDAPTYFGYIASDLEHFSK